MRAQLSLTVAFLFAVFSAASVLVAGEPPATHEAGAAQPTLVSTLPHEAYVTRVVFSPDGRWLTTSTGNFVHGFTLNPYAQKGAVRVFDASDWKQRLRIEYSGRRDSIAFSFDSKHLLTGPFPAEVLDIPSGNLVSRPAKPVDLFLPDGRLLNRVFQITDATTGRYVESVLPELTDERRRANVESESLPYVAQSPDGRHLALIEQVTPRDGLHYQNIYLVCCSPWKATLVRGECHALGIAWLSSATFLVSDAPEFGRALLVEIDPIKVGIIEANIGLELTRISPTRVAYLGFRAGADARRTFVGVYDTQQTRRIAEWDLGRQGRAPTLAATSDGAYLAIGGDRKATVWRISDALQSAK